MRKRRQGRERAAAARALRDQRGAQRAPALVRALELFAVLAVDLVHLGHVAVLKVVLPPYEAPRHILDLLLLLAELLFQPRDLACERDAACPISTA